MDFDGDVVREKVNSPLLTIGQMLLPVIPFVVVFILPSFIYLDFSTWTQTKRISNVVSISEMVDFQWKLGPYVLSSLSTTGESLEEQANSSLPNEQFNEALSVSHDRARSVVAICVFPVALIAWIVIGRFSKWHSRVTVPNSRFYSPLQVVGLCMGILFALVIGFALMKSSWPPGVSELVRHYGIRAGFITFVSMVIVAPVAEELFFRSFLCRFLVERIGPVAGIFLQALIFGSGHFATPLHMPVAFAGGIVLGMVYVYTRSLWASIFLHASSNALLVGACMAIG